LLAVILNALHIVNNLIIFVFSLTIFAKQCVSPGSWHGTRQRKSTKPKSSWHSV